MMSAMGGGKGVPPKADDSTDKLRECDNVKGEGITKTENFADVICTCHFTVQVRHKDSMLHRSTMPSNLKRIYARSPFYLAGAFLCNLDGSLALLFPPSSLSPAAAVKSCLKSL